MYWLQVRCPGSRRGGKSGREFPSGRLAKPAFRGTRGETRSPESDLEFGAWPGASPRSFPDLFRLRAPGHPENRRFQKCSELSSQPSAYLGVLSPAHCEGGGSRLFFKNFDGASPGPAELQSRTATLAEPLPLRCGSRSCARTRCHASRASRSFGARP